MTSTHDWDAGSALTLVLEPMGSIALIAPLVGAVRD